VTGVDTNLSIDSRRDFLQALRRILRPIIRLMIRSGIRYDEFVDVARGAYVESAIRDVDNDAPRPTRDQVAWTTGIQRDLVDHYIESNEPLPSGDRISARVETEVLHRWYTDPRYLGPTGTPLELEFDAPDGMSFKELVAQTDPQADAGLILEQLLRTKSVAHSGNNHIRALSRYFIWPGEGQARIKCLGTSLAHMIETLEYNINSGVTENKRLERTVSTDRGISDQQLPSFQEFARERTEQFLIDLDDWLGQRLGPSANQIDQRVEIGINVFLYVESPPDLSALATLVRPPRVLSHQDGNRDQ
jgi:hypothetical protein